MFPNNLAIFKVSKFATKKFQKSPNLVTLAVIRLRKKVTKNVEKELLL